jgi:hypothetical protein
LRGLKQQNRREDNRVKRCSVFLFVTKPFQVLLRVVLGDALSRQLKAFKALVQLFHSSCLIYKPVNQLETTAECTNKLDTLMWSKGKRQNLLLILWVGRNATRVIMSQRRIHADTEINLGEQ